MGTATPAQSPATVDVNLRIPSLESCSPVGLTHLPEELAFGNSVLFFIFIFLFFFHVSLFSSRCRQREKGEVNRVRGRTASSSPCYQLHRPERPKEDTDTFLPARNIWI